MKKLACSTLLLALVAVLGQILVGVPNTARAGGDEEKCAAENGDVDGSGKVDISDPIQLLSHLFLGDPPELIALCAPPELSACEAELQDTKAELIATKAALAEAQANLAVCRSALEDCRVGNSVGLPDSGLETECHDQTGKVIDCASDTCAGQDGSYATGCPSEGRFFDNGDGTATDTCTGLMWERVTGNSGAVLSWCGALAYCEELELAGHEDWRLPNVREIQSIVDYGRPTTSVFEAQATYYWSSTSFHFGADRAWMVGSIFSGGAIVDQKFNGHLVRAVRTVR